MPLIDLVGPAAEASREEESERLVFESTQVAFDLARGPAAALAAAAPRTPTSTS